MADIEDIKSQIDLLYKNVSQYRSCIELKKQIEFCARFKSMSMFNAILIEKHPYYAVFRDKGMESDSVMTNFEQIFAAISPNTTRKML